MPRLFLLTALPLVLLALAPPAAPSDGAKVYFLEGEQFVPVARKVPARPLPALKALLAGPTAGERARGLRSALPRGARVVAVSLGAGTARVALRYPAEPGGAFVASLAPARLAQVAATLKGLPGVDRVAIAVNGHHLVAPNSPAPTSSPPEPPDLEPSAPAPENTLAVQARLYQLHYLPLSAVTGIWDYRSQQAVEAIQSWEGLDRDGEVGTHTLASLDSAAVPVPRGRGAGKWIEVYREKGVTLLVRNGVVQRALHASTGRPGFETPTGTYHVFRKERFSWSAPYQVWLPYASYFVNGVAFHAFPEIPTSPGSHGCVRLPYPEAPLVYAFATLGTAVVVYS